MVDLKNKNATKGWALLAAAVFISLVAFALANKYLTSKESSIRMEVLGLAPEKLAYVVASRDVLPGDIVSLDNMSIAQLAPENISQFAIVPEEFAKIQGRVIEFPMSTGEPLLSHFVKGSAIGRFSDLLAVNERAVTLEIDSNNSAAGMLLAGDYVDILLLMESSEDEDEGEGKLLKPLLQKVRILSVDAMPLLSQDQEFVNEYNRGEAYSTITVGLPFDSASRLVLARQVGDIVFMLRNQDDSTLNEDGIIKPLDLTSGSASANQYAFYSASEATGGSITPLIKSFSVGVSQSKYQNVISIKKVFDEAGEK